MCLIFIAQHAHPDYPLIIAANRDEFYQRPTALADYWQDNPRILAGRDEQAGGTWLGINRDGRFAAVTNFRENDSASYASSRGDIPVHYLSDTSDSQTFGEYLQQQGHSYSGFNCLFGQLGADAQLHYYSNRNSNTPNTAQPLVPGIYGLSNGLLDSNWFKIEQGKQEIEQLLSQPFSQEQWFSFLNDQTKAEDHALPDTGVAVATEKLLSSRFIHSESYGTRCSTLITVDHKGLIQFCERSYNEQAQAVNTQVFQFPLIEQPS